jgi:uncharacterized protein (DUF983 family)
MLLRGLFQRCPVCGAGKTHTKWVKMNERCHRCDLRFERVVGHSLGYVGLNTIVTFTATFAVLMGGAILTMPNVPFGPLVAASLVPGLILPVVFLPSSHTMWTAIDLIMRPLKPGEVDPRFVKVDPETAPARRRGR